MSGLIEILTENRIQFRKIDRSEPEWLYRLRKEAWDFYNDIPMPERTSNVWRYVDPGNFLMAQPENLMHKLPVIPDGSSQDVREMSPEYSAFGYNRSDLLTFAQMDPELSEAGVVFDDLYSVCRHNPGLSENYFGKIIGAQFGKFEALNMALWNNGLFLYIPPNTVIEKPIYLHRHPTGQSTLTRLLVVVAENSQATVIDDYSCHCRHAGAITNSVVEIIAGDSSNMRYANIQRLSEDSRIFITQRSRIGQNANIVSIFGGTGGLISKINAGTLLEGRGANSQMYGIVFGDGRQQFDYHTSQHHKTGGSFSNLSFRVVLKEKARSAYTGLIRIEKDAADCEAYQENRNLMLDKETKADSIPELEILTDQVRCTHGATMGPVDPEMIFYLKSRGMDEAEARKAIVSGFAEPLMAKIPNGVAEIMRGLIKVKLEGTIHGA